MDSKRDESPMQGLDPPTAARTESTSEAGAAPELDPQQLADKVYRLMCAEARLERARGLAGGEE